MSGNTESLFFVLLLLSFIRVCGLILSLDLFFQRREQRYLLFIFAWLLGMAGPILGILTLHNPSFYQSQSMWTLFSLLGGISTLLIVIGTISYFREIKRSYVLVGSLVFICFVFLIKLIFNLDISTHFSLFTQIASLIFIMGIVSIKHKQFKGIAPRSYYWLLIITAMGLVHALGFIFYYKNQSIGFTGTCFFAILSILFLQNLENELNLKELKGISKYRTTLFQKSPIGFALTTLDGSFIEINTAYTVITGWTAEEVLNKTIWEITADDYLESELAQIQLLQSMESTKPYEKKYIHKKGHLVDIRISRRIIDLSGEVYILSSIEDISDQKQAELEILKYKNNLEEQVKDKTRILEERAETLSDSQQALVNLLEDVYETREDLKKKNKELEEFNDLFVDREFRIKELRDRVNELELKINLRPSQKAQISQ